MRSPIFMSLALMAALVLAFAGGCSKKAEKPPKPENVTVAPDNTTTPAKKGVFERAGETTGKALKEGAKKTGEVLEKGAVETGKALDKARRATGKAVKETGEWMLDNETK